MDRMPHKDNALEAAAHGHDQDQRNGLQRRHDLQPPSQCKKRRPKSGQPIDEPTSSRTDQQKDDKLSAHILSDDFIRAVVGFAIAFEGGRARAFVDGLKARGDLGVLALEQAIAL